MAFARRPKPDDEEGQDEWFRYEFYRDDNGLPGMAIVTKRGTMEYFDYNEWFNRSDAKELESYAEEQGKIWCFPENPKQYLEEFLKRIEGLRNSGEHPEDHGLAEAFTRSVLTEIEHDLSLLDPLFLKMDSEVLYSFVHSIVVHSYFVEEFEVSPLVFLDAEHGSGKSTLLDYFKALCYRAVKMTNYSAASLALIADKYRSTLLLDEATKNFRDRDRGYSITNILTEGFSKHDATYIRTKGENYESVKAQYHYTSVVASLLEDCPSDLKDRAIVVRMLKDLSGFKPMRVFGYDKYEVAEKLTMNVSEIPTFDKIRTKLYALKLLVTLLEVRKEPAAFSFKPFENEAKRFLRKSEVKDGQTKYLYGEVYGIQNAPEFQGRAEDICLVHLPIGLAMGTDEDIIQLMVDRIADDPDLELSTEATLLRAFMDVVRIKLSEECIKGVSDESPTWEDLSRMIAKMSTKDVRQQYIAIRADRDDWTPYDMEAPKMLTALLKRFGFTYDTGTSGKSFFTPGERFRRGLRSAVKNYGGAEVRHYFSRI